MNRPGRYQGIDERAGKIVRFDRFHAARLREGIKAATTEALPRARLSHAAAVPDRPGGYLRTSRSSRT